MDENSENNDTVADGLEKERRPLFGNEHPVEMGAILAATLVVAFILLFT